MSKIICDVCGTSYPDTANQCPICGKLKQDNPASATDTVNAQDNGYAYVKGGRFSHANVRKRNGGKTELPRVAPVKPAVSEVVPSEPVIQETSQPTVEAPIFDASVQQTPQESEQETVIPVMPEFVEPDMPKEQKIHRESAAVAVAAPRRRKRRKKENPVVNIVLLLIVILLVLAIVGVCAYITIDLLHRATDPGKPSGSSSSQVDPTGSSRQDPTQIPCMGLQIIPSTPQTFSSVGQTLLLEVKKYPGDTTDKVLFSSSDPYIASVDAAGKITAVADGNVTITVTCGKAVVKLEITCQVGRAPEYPRDPTESTTSQPGQTSNPTVPYVKLELQHTDITMNSYGETSNLYAGQLDPSAITWSSEDESVATVTNGIVKAIGKGTTKIIAQYGDQKVECVVRCSDDVVKPEYFLYTQYGKLKSPYDVTIKEGESLTFSLHDADGNKITEGVTYSVSDEAHLSVTENGKIKGLEVDSLTTVYLYVEYEGVVYKCVIRIRNVHKDGE